MKKKWILWAALMLACGQPAPALAQQRIDDLVGRISSLGGVTFTSTLQRDPATRRVHTITRQLDVDGDRGLCRRLVDAFRQEARRATRSERTVKDNTVSHWLRFSTPKRESIYRLTARGREQASVIIVIRIKK